MKPYFNNSFKNHFRPYCGGGGFPFEDGSILDGISVNAAYSIRKLKLDYTGYLLQITDSEDNIFNCFPNDMGLFGMDSITDFEGKTVSECVGEFSAFVSIMYDQSGGGNHAFQPELEKMMQIIDDGELLTDANGLPVIQSTGTSTGYYSLVKLYNLDAQKVSVFGVQSFNNSAKSSIYLLSSNADFGLLVLSNGTTETPRLATVRERGSSILNYGTGAWRGHKCFSFEANRITCDFYLNNISQGSFTDKNSNFLDFDFCGIWGHGDIVARSLDGFGQELIITETEADIRNLILSNQVEFFNIA